MINSPADKIKIGNTELVICSALNVRLQKDGAEGFTNASIGWQIRTLSDRGDGFP